MDKIDKSLNEKRNSDHKFSTCKRVVFPLPLLPYIKPKLKEFIQEKKKKQQTP